MTWYGDLTPIDGFLFEGATSLRAVGWLDTTHAFETGRTSPEDFESLCRLLAEPWQPVVFAGTHACQLCQHTRGPSLLRYGDIHVSLGATNAFIPAGAVIYVVPLLVAHYIDAHHNRPPDEFLAAMRSCPSMASMQYKRALLAAGGRALLDARRGR
jgi:hypothetical protein